MRRKIRRLRKRLLNVRRSSVALSVIGAVICIPLGSLPSLSAHADSVEKILNQGNNLPKNYGVYRDRVFFARRGKLLRLDAPGRPAVEVTIQHPLLDENFTDAEFASFDDHLFISVGGKLFRLRDPDGELTEIDTRIRGRDEEYLASQEPRAAYPRSFTVYKNHLYFTANEPKWCHSASASRPYIYRLRSADEKLEYVEPQIIGCPDDDYYSFQLTPSEAGLIIQEHRTSNVVWGSEHSRVHIISDPTAYPLSATPPERGYPDPLTYCGTQSETKAAYFDEDYYFSGRFYGSEGLSNPAGTVGPIDTLCEGPLDLNSWWQAEPLRFDIESGTSEYFDLYQLSETERQYYEWLGGDSNNEKSFGSSNPDNFVVANNVLYFSAATRGVNRELFRKTVACPVPQAIALNPDRPSRSRPIGEFLGRLWFFADTGSGLALHYLDDDGLSAVTLEADIIVSESAVNRDNPTGFVEYDGGVLFTATSTGGERGTYIARIDRDPPLPPAIDEPCLQTQPSDPLERPKFQSSITVNGAVNGTGRDRHKVASGSPVELNCRATLLYDSMSVVRTQIMANRPGVPGNQILRSCARNMTPFVSRNLCRVTVPAQTGLTRYFCRYATPDEEGRIVVKRKLSRVIGVRGPR